MPQTESGRNVSIPPNFAGRSPGFADRSKVSAAQSHVQDILAGLLLALVTFAYSISLGALIFSGRLSEYAGLGVVSALLSAAVATLLIVSLQLVQACPRWP